MCICEICEQEIEEKYMNEHNGSVYCDDCYNENYTTCEKCGETIEIESAQYYDGEYYCADCFDKNFMYCDDCEEYYPLDDMYYTAYGYYICQSCYNESYMTCDDCGEIYSYDDMNNSDYSNLCDNCYKEQMYQMGINDYCYSPDIVFYENDDEAQCRTNNLHIGIELEIQGNGRYEFCTNLTSEYDEATFYLKEDGSLDSNGVEIVSQPMSYNYICQNGDWKNVFDLMNTNDMNNTSGCGLHFHLDKMYLTEDNIKVIDFIVNMFSEYFEKIGGRKFGQYCYKEDKHFANWGRSCGSRYVAVNLENVDTVELRFCKSTDDYDTFINRLTAIYNIVKFAKQYQFNQIQELSIEEFINVFENIK